MPKKRIVYLIDGTAYIHRGYHAVRSLSNSRGLPTNAAFSFTRMLIKFMKERQPQYAVVLFDARGPTFRHDIYKEYKANRAAMPEDMAVQIPYIKKIVEGFRIPMLEMPGFEADDLIGTLARQAVAAGFEVVIVSGDKDFAQLVTDHVTIWDPLKEISVDAEAVKKKLGIEPSQVIDAMALSGDTSDNVPGVPGIGEKTALGLIQEFGSLDSIYSRVDEITKKKQKENLISFKDQAYLSRQLVTIDTAAPVTYDAKAFMVAEPDNNALSDLFGELEFAALQKEFPRESDLSGKQYTAILRVEDLDRLTDRLGRAPAFSLDTETTGLDTMTVRLVGLSFSLKADEAFYIPVGHDYDGAPEQLDLETIAARLRPALENPNILKVGQNIKYDLTILARYGLTVRGPMFDTMVAAYLLNPARRGYGLDQLALDYLDHRMISYAEVTGTGRDAICFSKVAIDKAATYSGEDADITFCVYRLLSERLQEAGLTELFEKIEMPLVPVLTAMEMRGVLVDPEALLALSKQFEGQLEQLEKEIYGLAGEAFNINSPQQLGVILFEKLKLPTQKKTKKKTGYSTDADVLETLAEHHELPAALLRHRTLSKLKSTYADALFGLINPDTGRIHTSFNQTATATGRLSSTEPNLQNIPIRTEEGRLIRRAFIPRPGWEFISADYSQIELRILAHYSQDPILIEAFEKDEDIHTRTASEVFQVFPEMITEDVRRQAKAINFGIVYGISAFGLSRDLGISQKMAKNYIDSYLDRYRGVRQFMDGAIESARKNKQTRTLFGRIRHLPDIDNSNFAVRGFAERAAINTPIQGTAADIIKLAMIAVEKELTRRKLAAAMLLSVHDELVLESPPEEIDTVISLVRDIMEHVCDLAVHLKVNIATGRNWADAH
ncbi:MAG: DNA polymerase I [Thermodesulfobacteriota bacterium]